MNPRIPVLVGMAGSLIAIGTAVANANGLFTGHPHLAYWFYGAALILIGVAFYFSRRPHNNVSPLAQRDPRIRDSFNPSQNITASPTINVYPPEPKREAQKKLHSEPQAAQIEPNLVICRVWKERLFRINDEFSFHVPSGMENKFPIFQAIIAEIKNASSDSAVGYARNIKAELVFDGDRISIGPMAWIGKTANTISIEMGDSEYILLAAYLVERFLPKMSEWRLPVNSRPRSDHLPGANLIELRQGKQGNGAVRLNILHPESGRIVRSFSGGYSWPSAEQEPSFTFAG